MYQLIYVGSSRSRRSNRLLFATKHLILGQVFPGQTRQAGQGICNDACTLGSQLLDEAKAWGLHCC